MIISSIPVVFLTSNNSSLSFNVIAILPFVLILSNSLILVLLINPSLVQNTKYLHNSSFSIFNIDLIDSSFSNGNKFTIGKPFDCLLNRGTS